MVVLSKIFPSHHNKSLYTESTRFEHRISSISTANIRFQTGNIFVKELIIQSPNVSWHGNQGSEINSGK